MVEFKDQLFVGIRGHIVAIDAGTGRELWRTKLKASGMATVFVMGRRLFGASLGEVFCLDPNTGRILWCNPLKGLGLGFVAFPGSSDFIEVERQRRASAASG